MTPLDCIRGRLDGADDLTDAELRDVIADLQQRARRRQAERQLDTADTALFDAAEDVVRELDIAAVIERRNAALHALVAASLDRKRAGFADWYQTLEAHLVGINANRQGGRLSIDARGLALEARLLGGLVAELRRQNLLPFLTRRQGPLFRGEGVIDRDVAREMWQLDRPDGTPGVTGNREARAIAAILHQYQEAARRMQNRAGAFIRRMPGYIVRQSHDEGRLRRAGFAAWRDFILPLLDAERTFAGADPEELLRGAYDGLVTGTHLRTAGNAPAGGFTGPANLAKRLSQERVLHFRTADDWYDYHRRFGRGSLMEAVAGGLSHAARNTAIMQGLGTNPRAMFDRMLRQAREQSRGDLAVSDKLRGGMLENFFREIDGTTRQTVNVRMATIFRTWRALNVLSKLGGSVISSITDLPAQAAELRWQGGSLLDGYTQALRNLGPKGPQQRAAADLLRVGVEGLLGSVAARFSSNDDLPGAIGKAVRLFFRLNLQQWWNDAHKQGFALMMSRHLAQLADQAWDGLDADTVRVLGLFEIGGREWDVIRAHAVREAPDGTTMIVPEAIQDAPDAAIAALVDGDVTARKLAAARDELETRLQAYYSDRVDHAVLTPGARERAFANLGTQPGTVLGEVARMFWQFKQFPLTVITRALGRELNGRGHGALFGLVHLAVAMTALGYVAMAGKDLSKGRQPRDPTDPATWAAAFVQGGGAGIYGDFLMGEFNRFGGGFVDTLGGPAAGQLSDVARLYANMRDGDGNAANQLFRLAKNNTPFLNLFYTRVLFDYLFLYQMQEMVAPGSLRRMERTLARENNQRFILPPSEAVR